MRDIGLVAFLTLLLALGFRRPFLFVLAYAYVDIVSPHRLSYYMLNSIPVSLICFLLAVGGWAVSDSKKDFHIAPRQWLLIILLIWAGYTTMTADLYSYALEKWDWVWKALLFAIFLPFTLRTKLRIESLLVFMVISAASIIIVGGIKTLGSGGGYGTLNLLIESNTGLYEGSTISTVAVAIIPLILYLGKYGTIFPPDKRVRLFCAALVFACLLIPIGTVARTGLICIAVLGALTLRATKKRMLYLTMMGIGGLIAIPLLPQSYTSRMNTIEGYQADTSASTRLAVWAWTWDYVKEHPFGGGFEAYRQNQLVIQMQQTSGTDSNSAITTSTSTDRARAYHSSYFEMLGEQGFPGFGLWILLHLSGLIAMEKLRRRFIKSTGDEEWISPLATALQNGQIVYMVGSLFVGIAFQPFVFMLLGVQIALVEYVRQKDKRATRHEMARQYGGSGPGVVVGAAG